MDRAEYKGFVVTLSDVDTNKLDKAWSGAEQHWTCTVKDPVNRKQMSFDVFGVSNATMHPLKALYLYVNDAYTYACYTVDDLVVDCGYTYREAKKVYKKMENAYYKCRKFIGDVENIYEIVEELREEWG